MAELRLKSHRFRAEREADWRRLETLLARAQRGARNLRRDELVEMPVLYGQALSSLSVARAISLDQSLIDYLEDLSTRAYFFIYGPRTSLLERLANFFRRDWPQAVGGLWRETLLSAAIMAAAAVAAYLLVTRDPSWFSMFVAPQLAAGRTPEATTAFLEASLRHTSSGHEGLSILATFLFTHNAQISVFAFALGMAFCLPTAGLMALNGAMAGAFMAVFAAHGLAFEAGGWMLIHGATELFAVTLAGAAGFRLGWAVVFPGARSRVDAMAAAGRHAGMVMAGVLVMLLIAGLLEGFARQLIQNDLVRWAIAGASFAAWCLYFYLPRRSAP